MSGGHDLTLNLKNIGAKDLSIGFLELPPDIKMHGLNKHFCKLGGITSSPTLNLDLNVDSLSYKNQPWDHY